MRQIGKSSHYQTYVDRVVVRQMVAVYAENQFGTCMILIFSYSFLFFLLYFSSSIMTSCPDSNLGPVWERLNT